MTGSVDELLALKQEVLDALEEYYGTITKATRFSDAVPIDGEPRFLDFYYSRRSMHFRAWRPRSVIE